MTGGPVPAQQRCKVQIGKVVSRSINLRATCISATVDQARAAALKPDRPIGPECCANQLGGVTLPSDPRIFRVSYVSGFSCFS